MDEVNEVNEDVSVEEAHPQEQNQNRSNNCLF